MRIRHFEPRDAEAINAIQKRYPEMWDGLPDRDVHVDFNAKDNLMVLVAEEDDGTFIAAVGAIHRYEVWATMDRGAHSPSVYVRILQQLFFKMVCEMFRAGYNAGFATVPPKLKSWSNMLRKRFHFERVVGPDLFWFNAKREIDRATES